MFPKEIENIINGLDYKIDDMGRSNDTVYIFSDKYILKVSKDSNVLKREYEKNKWLSSYIPCSNPILYLEENGLFYYLRTFVKGNSLCDKKYINNPELLIDILAKAIKLFRNLDNKSCPFNSLEGIGDSFVHGDLCLPNIYVDDNNELSGFIDLDNSGLGDPWYDYAWALWSLEYNLKTNKYNKLFLDKIGVEYDDLKYKKYIPEECIRMLGE